MQFSVFSLFENNNTLFTKIQSAIIDLIYFSFPKQMHPSNKATLSSTFFGKWFLVMTSISYRISSYIFFSRFRVVLSGNAEKKNTENLWITLSIIWQVLYCKYEIPFWFDSIRVLRKNGMLCCQLEEQFNLLRRILDPDNLDAPFPSFSIFCFFHYPKWFNLINFCFFTSRIEEIDLLASQCFSFYFVLVVVVSDVIVIVIVIVF